MLDHSTTHSRSRERDARNSEGVSFTQIKERPEKEIDKTKASFWKIILFVFLGVLILIILSVGILFYKYPLVAKAFYNFVVPSTDQITSKSGAVNILVMGKSGGIHEGADLTDTMFIVSIPFEKSGISTVSIPRDLWIPDLRAKINSAYYWGKEGTSYYTVEETGGGISFAKKVAGEVSGQEIQYGVVVDFSAFKDIVDSIGGIEVNVENGFTDNLYPIEGKENDTCKGDEDDSLARETYACRYEVISFEAGVQKMDGQTALKFVRSRHAEGDEGTDIAREARQQKVIKAIKDKIMSAKVLFSPSAISKIFLIIEKYVETDVELPTAGDLARLAYDSSGDIHQNILPEALLEHPPTSPIYDNLYVLIPKTGNGKWEEIQKWFTSAFENRNTSSPL
ncbi:MAG: Cell envelope-related transcriptional attenuator [Candidatus Woesebacteria bacterium GW2011_GWA1_41_7]|uniref:Cell envelope-related transcriptional attenuator n=2 Tax=Candidatus Woeseibacteriota TaxID=1752722 RepID=A0A0G0X0S8_9BACT|nr:MAG: Cell envelope-related transcriptional attenuator [Candidatus Woesebacteria bacterium GW2011_GWE1_41_24]KKS18654.1 MAG: Cell envelope-related transcriptional attenuator [Candidatus Woesebacteria bacterium GW2011_GWA1_41_7]